MVCSDGLLSVVSDGVVTGYSNLVPALIVTGKIAAGAAFLLVPAFILFIFAGKRESKRIGREVRGTYSKV